VADLATEIVVYLLLWSSALGSWLNSRHNGSLKDAYACFRLWVQSQSTKDRFGLSFLFFFKGIEEMGGEVSPYFPE
jgi:hypothetical protein